MDAGLLNFHENEQFSSLDSDYFLDASGDESQSMHDVRSSSDRTYSWEWTSERQYNDISSSILTEEQTTMAIDTSALINEWTQYISMDVTANPQLPTNPDGIVLPTVSASTQHDLTLINEVITKVALEENVQLDKQIETSELPSVPLEPPAELLQNPEELLDIDLRPRDVIEAPTASLNDSTSSLNDSMLKNELPEDTLSLFADGFDLPSFICQSEELPLDDLTANKYNDLSSYSEKSKTYDAEQVYNSENMVYNAESNVYNTETGGYNTETKDYNTESKRYNTESKGYNTESKGYNTDTKGYNAETKRFNAESNGYKAESSAYNVESEAYNAEPYNAEPKPYTGEIDFYNRQETKKEKLKTEAKEASLPRKTKIKAEPSEQRPVLAPVKPKSIGPGGKKIDMKAGRYLIEESSSSDDEDDEIDVETISERGQSPALEARDLDSLLEQFEAETNDEDSEAYPAVQRDPGLQKRTEMASQKTDPALQKKTDLALQNKVDTTLRKVSPVIQKMDPALQKMDPLLQRKTENAKYEKSRNLAKVTGKMDMRKGSSNKSKCLDETHNGKPFKRKDAVKRNLDSVPEDLLNRMKESNKKRAISVIEPIPSRKRGRPPLDEDGHKNKVLKVEQKANKPKPIKPAPNAIYDGLLIIKKEHDYCQQPGTILKYVKQEVVSESEDEEAMIPTNNLKIEHFKSETATSLAVKEITAEVKPIKEEVERVLPQIATIKQDNVLHNQPTVKNADGKLMVSLLKTNTIKSNPISSAADQQQKKKLNLEEYKKRRDIAFKSNNTSRSSSCQSSPKQEFEDEDTKRRKHQELLMKMASEVLKAKKRDMQESQQPAQEIKTEVVEVKVEEKPKPPPNLEVKTLVSMWTMTDESWEDHDKLDEIKPILENAAVKISSNSLIASLIKNIPKVKSKKSSDLIQSAVGEHGENKTIVYLDKNRVLPEVVSVHVQTDSSWCIDNAKTLVDTIEDDRASRASSRYSRSTSRSSMSPSSRSPSPVRRRRYRSTSSEAEKIREVEERRVVYVGRISSSTTREDLRTRFESFGCITNVSVHYRTAADNYGFVTFKRKQDAYKAVEHGNDDPSYPHLDLSFGGRRMFCKTNYSDLDNVRDDEYYAPIRSEEVSFDYLLRDFQKLRRRKL